MAACAFSKLPPTGDRYFPSSFEVYKEEFSLQKSVLFEFLSTLKHENRYYWIITSTYICIYCQLLQHKTLRKLPERHCSTPDQSKLATGSSVQIAHNSTRMLRSCTRATVWNCFLNRFRGKLFHKNGEPFTIIFHQLLYQKTKNKI